MFDLPDTVYAIQHLAFEDLGAWEDVLYEQGLRVRYFEAGVENLEKAFAHEGLVIILGGPIGVYEITDYPFLQQEIDLLKVRLAKNLPTIGICLGAQLIAHALGARSLCRPYQRNWLETLSLADAVHHPLAALADTPVLHWHGDTFDLPAR